MTLENTSSTLSDTEPLPDTNLERMKGILDKLYNVETILSAEGLDPSVPLSQVTLTQAIKSVQVARQLAVKLVDAEKKLAEAEQVAFMMISAAPIAIIIVDSENKIKFWNNPAVDLYGFTQEEAIEHDLTTLIVPERFRERHVYGFRRWVANRGTSQILNRPIRMQAIHKNGFEFEVEMLIGPIMTQGALLFLAFSRPTSVPREEQSPRIEELM